MGVGEDTGCVLESTRGEDQQLDAVNGCVYINR